MSQARMDACDHCGKRVEDRYAERDWIHFSGMGSANVGITIGRRKDKTAESRFKSGFHPEMDFCDTKCLLGWLKSIPGPVVRTT